MPLAIIDTREHLDSNRLDLLQRGYHCLGRSICVFTDASYNADTNPESGGLGIFLESDAKGVAAKIDISAHFPHCYYDKAQPLLLPSSLGTNVLLIELVAIHKALEWVHHTHTCLTQKDEVNIFVDSILSLFLLSSFSQDPTLAKTMGSHRPEERILLHDVILPVLRSIDEVAKTLKCDVNLHKVKAHHGIDGNEMADRLAKIGRCLRDCNRLTLWDGPNLPLPFKQVGRTYQPSNLPVPLKQESNTYHRLKLMNHSKRKVTQLMPYSKPKMTTPSSRPKMPPAHISVVPALTMLPIC